jgi:hypothetical protein
MTTIAYRSGILVADSQLTGDRITRMRKVKRLPCGSLMASCGAYPAITILEQWLRDGMPAARPTIPKGQAAETLVIRPDGAIHMFDHLFAMIVAEDEFMAIGVGAGYALGAMAMGASALTAVRIAARYDSATSAPIHTIRFKKGVRQ